MGILGAGFGFIGSGAIIIIIPILLMNKGRSRIQCILRKAQRVSSHISDKTGGSPTADRHTFIQLLRDGHGTPRCHTQSA